MRDAGDGLPERGEFFGLQQLVIQIARLVLEFLALAHVAHQRVDADRSILRRRIGVRRYFDPDRRIVDAPQPQQVVGDRAFRCEAIDERNARVGIDEARRIERANLRVAGFGGVAEHHFEVGIGREGFRLTRPEKPDVNAFVNRLEQPCEGVGAVLGQVIYPAAGEESAFRWSGSAGGSRPAPSCESP